MAFQFLFLSVCLLAEDGPLRPAKVRRAALPQEYQLINFLQSAENLKPSWTPDRPLSEWQGVMVSPQGAKRLHWSDYQIRGQLSWTCLPLTLEHVILSHNGLEGDTNLTMLPPHLVTLAIDNNRFVGCPELTQLPPTLVSLKFGYNDFSGDVDFGSLPNGMMHLHGEFNGNMGGIISVRDLPHPLRTGSYLFVGTRVEVNY